MKGPIDEEALRAALEEETRRITGNPNAKIVGGLGGIGADRILDKKNVKFETNQLQKLLGLQRDQISKLANNDDEKWIRRVMRGLYLVNTGSPEYIKRVESRRAN